MAERVVLHVGAMKSGTSFVQNVLGVHKEQLAAQGVLFAGSRWKAQVRAVKDFIGHGGPDQPPLAADGPWRELVAEIDAWQSTAVVSMEFLGPRTLPQVERLRDAFAGARVEAVLSCRDLGRTIPAMWLESVQNGSTTGWADFLEAVRTDDRSVAAGRNFWRHQSIPAMAARWSKGVGADRLTVLTVPPPGAEPGLLWARFAGVLGVAADGFDLEVRANPSIGLATAQVLLELNRAMTEANGGRLPGYYDHYVKHLLAKRGLVARQGIEPRLGLEEGWVDAAGRRRVRRLRAAGHRVVGDLDELLPHAVAGVHADDVPAQERLAAAVDGLAHLVEGWSTSDRQHRRAARAARRAGPAGPAGPAGAAGRAGAS